jgi:hypothetical protein
VVSAPGGIALGSGCDVTGANACAIGGYGGYAHTPYSTVIAGGATAVQLGVDGSYAIAIGQGAVALHEGSTMIANGTNNYIFSQANDEFAVCAVGGVRILTGIANPAGVTLAPGSSAWATVSDQNAKKNFAPVNGEEVLNKLAAVPVEKWNYKWESDTNTPHIGPMAQAFKHAFYPGRDDKSITTLEFDGVELAAIQRLNEKVESGTRNTETQMEQLAAENAELKQRLNELETAVKRLTERK